MPLQMGSRVGFTEANLMLDIAEHRPDIGGVLAETVAEAAENAPGSDVGVYIAGMQHDHIFLVCRDHEFAKHLVGEIFSAISD